MRRKRKRRERRKIRKRRRRVRWRWLIKKQEGQEVVKQEEQEKGEKKVE